jgi:putative cell wall-binding protein
MTCKPKQSSIERGKPLDAPQIAQQLERAGVRVERAAGQNRYETAAQFARKYFPESNRAVVASGLDANMVDALTGSVLGGIKNAPVLLTNKDKIKQ